MRLSEEQDGHGVRLSAAGELDLATSGSLQDQLRRLCDLGGPVRLDLSEVTFVDSTGLRIILEGVRDFRAAGCGLVLERDVAPQVRKLVRMTSTEQILWPDG